MWNLCQGLSILIGGFLQRLWLCCPWLPCLAVILSVVLSLTLSAVPVCTHATSKVKRAPQTGFAGYLVLGKPLVHPEEKSLPSAGWDSTSRARRALGNLPCCWFAFEILLCSTGGWPHPAPQPDLPQAPLDVVVMGKSRCDHGAICPLCSWTRAQLFLLPPPH